METTVAERDLQAPPWFPADTADPSSGIDTFLRSRRGSGRPAGHQSRLGEVAGEVAERGFECVAPNGEWEVVAVESSGADREWRTWTLEAYADTFVPGEKRWPGDRAVAGAAPGPGAVAAGALEVLEMSATGVADGLDDLVIALNGHAAAYAAEREIEVEESVPPFMQLSFADRSAVVRSLVAPSHPEKDIWVLVALFCFMAYDTAAHMHTADAVAGGHPGLAAMGFARPDADGLWRFPDYSYGRQLASVHPDTTPSGDPR